MELLTPGGVAGVAVVRVQASERQAVLALLIAPGGGPLAARTARPQRAVLRLDGQDVDDVLVVDRGTVGLELHLHGAPAVVEALHRRFALRGGMAPSPAEQLLREAMSDAQLDLALEQRDVDFGAACATIARLAPELRAVARAAALARSRVAMALAGPQRVVLVGRQNAGKSTLFNRLLGRERALAGPTPGLTRDPVTERTVLAGYPYELVDTAGEGPTPAAADAAALARGREQRRDAIVVLVVDGTAPAAVDRELAGACDIVVCNKVDLPRGPWPAGMPCHAEVSAQLGELASLRATFGELLRARRGLGPAGPVGGFAALSPAQLALLQAVPG